MSLLRQLYGFESGRIERAEDWQDIARSLMAFVKSQGRRPVCGKGPERTKIGTYMYVVPCRFGMQWQWLIYDGEAGICVFVTRKPVPADYS